MKNGKAGGVNGITTELMKADLETTVAVLYELLLKISESERVPNDWRCGLIIRLPKKGNLMERNNTATLGCERTGQSDYHKN